MPRKLSLSVLLRAYLLAKAKDAIKLDIPPDLALTSNNLASLFSPFVEDLPDLFIALPALPPLQFSHVKGV